MNETIPTIGTEDFEATARAKLAGWWERAELDPEYPARTGTVLQLLAAVDYDCPDQTLYRLIDTGQFDPPPRRAGQLSWTASDVLRLVMLLECRRAWKPLSPLHSHKLSAYERGQQLAEASGKAESVYHDLERFDLRQLLIFLAEADHRQIREALRVAVQAKLKSEYGIEA